MEFVETDRQDREREEAERSARLLDPLNNHGLIQKIQNPDVLERCLELLAELRKHFERDGFNPEYDKAILERIYGDRGENRLREDLYDSYEDWLDTSQGSEEERVRDGYASPEQCRKNILQEIDEEIRRLKRYRKARTSVEAVRTQLETLRHSIPDAPGLDRLLRYEASLERGFDRTLSQLERLQRMRRGHSVPPPIKVDIAM
jgi:ATP-dependent Lon protease